MKLFSIEQYWQTREGENGSFSAVYGFDEIYDCVDKDNMRDEVLMVALDIIHVGDSINGYDGEFNFTRIADDSVALTAHNEAEDEVLESLSDSQESIFDVRLHNLLGPLVSRIPRP